MGGTSIVPRDSSKGSHGRGRFYISSIISDVLIYFLLLIICSITRTNIIGCLFPFHFDIFNFDSLFMELLSYISYCKSKIERRMLRYKLSRRRVRDGNPTRSRNGCSSGSTGDHEQDQDRQQQQQYQTPGSSSSIGISNRGMRAYMRSMAISSSSVSSITAPPAAVATTTTTRTRTTRNGDDNSKDDTAMLQKNEKEKEEVTTTTTAITTTTDPTIRSKVNSKSNSIPTTDTDDNDAATDAKVSFYAVNQQRIRLKSPLPIIAMKKKMVVLPATPTLFGHNANEFKSSSSSSSSSEVAATAAAARVAVVPTSSAFSHRPCSSSPRSPILYSGGNGTSTSTSIVNNKDGNNNKDHHPIRVIPSSRHHRLPSVPIIGIEEEENEEEKITMISDENEKKKSTATIAATINSIAIIPTTTKNDDTTATPFSSSVGSTSTSNSNSNNRPGCSSFFPRPARNNKYNHHHYHHRGFNTATYYHDGVVDDGDGGTMIPRSVMPSPLLSPSALSLLSSSTLMTTSSSSLAAAFPYHHPSTPSISPDNDNADEQYTHGDMRWMTTEQEQQNHVATPTPRRSLPKSPPKRVSLEHAIMQQNKNNDDDGNVDKDADDTTIMGGAYRGAMMGTPFSIQGNSMIDIKGGTNTYSCHAPLKMTMANNNNNNNYSRNSYGANNNYYRHNSNNVDYNYYHQQQQQQRNPCHDHLHHYHQQHNLIGHNRNLNLNYQPQQQQNEQRQDGKQDFGISFSSSPFNSIQPTSYYTATAATPTTINASPFAATATGTTFTTDYVTTTNTNKALSSVSPVDNEGFFPPPPTTSLLPQTSQRTFTAASTLIFMGSTTTTTTSINNTIGTIVNNDNNNKRARDDPMLFEMRNNKSKFGCPISSTTSLAYSNKKKRQKKNSCSISTSRNRTSDNNTVVDDDETFMSLSYRDDISSLANTHNESNYYSTTAAAAGNDDEMEDGNGFGDVLGVASPSTSFSYWQDVGDANDDENIYDDDSHDDNTTIASSTAACYHTPSPLKQKGNVRRIARRLVDGSSVATIKCGMRLAVPNDADHVNSLHCFVRAELLEVFVLDGMKNSDNYSSSTSSCNANTNKIKNSVGIRCVHCVQKSKEDRQGSSMSTFFPKSIEDIYRGVCTWQRIHFKNCHHIPDPLKQKYDRLKDDDRTRGKKAHWVSSARLIGLENIDDQRNGVIYNPGGNREKTAFKAAAVAGKSKKSKPASRSKPEAKSPQRVATMMMSSSLAEYQASTAAGKWL